MLTVSQHPPRVRRGIAGLLAVVLASAGLSVLGAAVPAFAASGPTITVTEAPIEGGNVTITGAGFKPAVLGDWAPGIYVGIGIAGATDFYGAAETLVDDKSVWVSTSVVTGENKLTMADDGSFSLTLRVPAASEGTSYSVYTAKVHGQAAADPSQSTITPISYVAAPTPTPEPTPEPTTPPTTAPAVAAVAVAPSAGLDAAGANFTVTGTGFTPNLNIYLGVAPKSVLNEDSWFGKTSYFASTKRVAVSADGTFSAAFTGVSATFTSGPTATTKTPVDCTVVECGVYTFSAVHTGTPDRTQDTYTKLSFAAVTPPTTTPTTPAGAKVTAAPSVGLDPTGATVTASGTGFTVAGSGIYVGVGPKSAMDDAAWFANADYFTAVKWVRAINADGSFSQVLSGVKSTFTSNGTAVDCTVVECGIYTFAAHGSTDRSNDTYTPVTFATTSGPSLPPVTTPTTPIYTPSQLVLSTGSLPVGGSITITGNGFKPYEQVGIVLHSDPVLLGTTRADSFGNFSFTTTIPAGVPVGEHTIIATGVESGATTQTGVTVATAQEICVARVVSGASLNWGVKSSFRNYITGGIAKGSVSVSGVSDSGSSYGWSGGSGSLNPTAVKGLVRYPGSVHFEGHEGVLNLTLSNVSIRVTSPNSGVIIADVVSSDMDGKASSASGIEFATLSLGGASVSGDSLRVSDAASTLTAAGAGAFAGFYAAGTALDPVSFSFPLGAETDCDLSTTSSLASTGVDGMPATLAGSMLLLVLGAGALVLTRRRRSGAAAQ